MLPADVGIVLQIRTCDSCCGTSGATITTKMKMVKVKLQVEPILTIITTSICNIIISIISDLPVIEKGYIIWLC
jgi:hypothetical protein